MDQGGDAGSSFSDQFAVGDSFTANGMDSSGNFATQATDMSQYTGGGGGGLDFSGIDWNSVATALPALTGVAGGLTNMFATGSNSQRGQHIAGAALADPFGPMRQQVTGMLPGAIQGMQGAAGTKDLAHLANDANPIFGMLPSITDSLWGSAGGAQVDPNVARTAANVGPSLAGLEGMAGTAKMNPFLAALQKNDPSMDFRYQQGLDAVNRGGAQTGTLGSGAQALELEKYGQGFASTEFANMFARQMQLQQQSQGLQAQNFGQKAAADEMGIRQAGQGAQQALQSGQYGLQVQGQNVNQLLGLNNMNINRGTMGVQNLLAGMNLDAQQQQTGFNQQAGIAQLLGQLASGGSSPGEAGRIFSGQADIINQAQTDMGGGVNTSARMAQQQQNSGGGGGFLQDVGSIAGIAAAFL